MLADAGPASDRPEPSPPERHVTGPGKVGAGPGEDRISRGRGGQDQWQAREVSGRGTTGPESVSPAAHSRGTGAVTL